MKLHSIALASLAMIAGAAAQAAPAVDIDDAATVRVYLTGASASRAAHAGVVLNDICGGSTANTTTTLYNVTESSGSFSFSGNYWAITCKLQAAGAAFIGLPVNTAIAFFKTDAGGSAEGVFPIYFNSDRNFVQPVPLSGCATTVTADRVYTGCPTTRVAKPMIGTSDVEPALFQGVNVPNDPLDPSVPSYPTGGLSQAQIAQMSVTPIFQTVFAVAVNANLYNAMFAKQGLASKKDASGAACTTASTDETCIPTIGYAEARTLFAGTEPNWRLLVSSSDSKLSSQVNICRRVQGSGTQASANAVLMGFPCNANAVSPADWTASSSAAPEAVSSFTGKTADTGKTIATYLDDNMGGPAVAGVFPAMPTDTTFVFEGPGTGDVVSCLTRANNGGGYAIGHVSKENVPNSNWKHVKLEGAFPSRDNLKVGRYDYAVESTIQYLKTAFNGFTANQKTFVTNFNKKVSLPDSLAKLSSANQQGVAALPTSYAGAFGTGTPNEIAFGSRVTRFGNTCTPLTASK